MIAIRTRWRLDDFFDVRFKQTSYSNPSERQVGKAFERAMSSLSRETVLSTWRLMRRFLPYLYAVRWQATLAGGLMLLSPLFAVLLLWLMKYFIDDVFIGKKHSCFADCR
jgi:hypothetical protein